MRTSIGSTATLYIFIIFFILVAFILTGTVIYYKGYKINSQIANSLEKYEGYNSYSAADMDRVFKNLGYRANYNNQFCVTSASSGEKNLCLGENGNYDFQLTCSRSNKNKGGQYEGGNYYVTYKVKTYIFIDLPFNTSLKIPVTAKTNPIYQFTDYENGLGC